MGGFDLFGVFYILPLLIPETGGQRVHGTTKAIRLTAQGILNPCDRSLDYHDPKSPVLHRTRSTVLTTMLSSRVSLSLMAPHVDYSTMPYT